MPWHFRAIAPIMCAIPLPQNITAQTSFSCPTKLFRWWYLKDRLGDKFSDGNRWYLFPFTSYQCDRSDQSIPHKIPSRQRGKQKRGPDIITDVPLDEDEVINEVTITRQSGRIHTTSKPVCVPLPPAPQQADTIPDTPERDGNVYSDTEGIELLPETRNRARRGPSCPVSVSLISTCQIVTPTIL